jgi:hypothetical protein
MREHGTRARYVNGPDENDQDDKGCRCPRCRKANTDEANKVYREKAYGHWRPFTDAEPVREHLKVLSSHGIKAKRVAQLSGVSSPNVVRIFEGRARRVRKETAEAILAVQPSMDLLTDRARIDGTGTRRRLQALIAVGWSRAKLAEHVGIHRTSLCLVLLGEGVRADTARKVVAAYSALWNQQPPTATVGERRAAAAARREAESRGWPPPAAWDDEWLDLPDDELRAELDRLATAMDDREVYRCHTARYKLKDQSPLVAAGARERTRRMKIQQAA